MRWSIYRPNVPSTVLDRLDRVRLRRAAIRYAEHGWTVTPGAHLVGHRFDCGRPGCPITTCHPAREPVSVRVGDQWRHRPYTVLFATGGSFDALEVPAALGTRVLDATRARSGGPVAVTAAGRWMFLVRPGHPLRPELEQRMDVLLHGEGSWIPAPPSRMIEGPVRWAVAPEENDWALPDPEAVQESLAEALRTRNTPPRLPRQMSRT